MTPTNLLVPIVAVVPDTPSPKKRKFRPYKTRTSQPYEDEFNKLNMEGQAALIEAMKRFELDKQLKNEVKILKDCKAASSKGRSAQVWELRVKVGTNPYRVLFIHQGARDQYCVALTAFFKNQEKTAAGDKDRAKRRAKLWLERDEN